jgi:hypothetical protein
MDFGEKTATDALSVEKEGSLSRRVPFVCMLIYFHFLMVADSGA